MLMFEYDKCRLEKEDIEKYILNNILFLQYY